MVATEGSHNAEKETGLNERGPDSFSSKGMRHPPSYATLTPLPPRVKQPPPPWVDKRRPYGTEAEPNDAALTRMTALGITRGSNSTPITDPIGYPITEEITEIEALPRSDWGVIWGVNVPDNH